MEHIVITDYALIITGNEATLLHHCSYYYDAQNCPEIVLFKSEEEALSFARMAGHELQNNMEITNENQ